MVHLDILGIVVHLGTLGTVEFLVIRVTQVIQDTLGSQDIVDILDRDIQDTAAYLATLE